MMPSRDGRSSVNHHRMMSSDTEDGCGRLVIDLPPSSHQEPHSTSMARGGVGHVPPSSGAVGSHPPPPDQPRQQQQQFAAAGNLLGIYPPELILQAQQQAALLDQAAAVAANPFLNLQYAAAASQLLFPASMGRMSHLMGAPAVGGPGTAYATPYFINPAAVATSVFYPGQQVAAGGTGGPAGFSLHALGGLTPEQAASLLTPMPFAQSMTNGRIASPMHAASLAAAAQQEAHCAMVNNKMGHQQASSGPTGALTVNVNSHYEPSGGANAQMKATLTDQPSQCSPASTTRTCSRGLPGGGAEGTTPCAGGADGGGGLLNSPEAVEKHIIKLIETNEAILKPSTVQPRAKRTSRFCQLPSTSNSSGSNSSGEECTKSPVKKAASNASGNGGGAVAGSATTPASGQPATHPSDPMHSHGALGRALPPAAAHALPAGAQVLGPQAAVVSLAVSSMTPYQQLLFLRQQQQMLGASSITAQQLSALSALQQPSPAGSHASLSSPGGHSLSQQSVGAMPTAILAAAGAGLQPGGVVPAGMPPTGILAPQQSTTTKLFKCPYCNNTFRNVESLKAHELRCAHKTVDEEAKAAALSLTSLGDVDTWRKIEGGIGMTGSNKQTATKRPASQGTGNSALPFKKRLLDVSAAASLVSPIMQNGPVSSGSDLCPTPPLIVEKTNSSSNLSGPPMENINNSIDAVLNSVREKTMAASSSTPAVSQQQRSHHASSQQQPHPASGSKAMCNQQAASMAGWKCYETVTSSSHMSPRSRAATNLVFVTPEKLSPVETLSGTSLVTAQQKMLLVSPTASSKLLGSPCRTAPAPVPQRSPKGTTDTAGSKVGVNVTSGRHSGAAATVAPASPLTSVTTAPAHTQAQRSKIPMLTHLEPIISSPGLITLSDCERTLTFKPYIPPPSASTTALTSSTATTVTSTAAGHAPASSSSLSAAFMTGQHLLPGAGSAAAAHSLSSSGAAKRHADVAMLLRQLTFATYSERGQTCPAERSEIVYWRPRCVSPLDAKLNILNMGAYNLRDTCSRPRVRYTLAPSAIGSTTERDGGSSTAPAVTVVSSNWALSTSGELQLLKTPALKKSPSIRADSSPEKLPKNEQNNNSLLASSSDSDAEKVAIKVENQHHASRTERSGGKRASTSATAKFPSKIRIFNGGFKSFEPYTYTKGRGRGAYVCELCGIRCIKPSILKKHIKSHTNERPFKCPHCEFSFKTKGNLTKHLKSQAHRHRHDSADDQCTNRATDWEVPEAVFSGHRSRPSGDGQSDGEVYDDSEEKYVITKPSVLKFCKDWDIPRRFAVTPPPSFGLLPEEPERPESAPPYCCISCVEDQTGAVNLCVQSLCASLKQPISVEIPSNNAHVTAFPPPPAAGGGSGNISQLYLNSVSEKPTCELCGQSFKNAGALRLHMNVHYLDNTAKRYEYKCPVCAAAFRSKAQLQKHQSAEHAGSQEQNSLDTPEKSDEASGLGGAGSSSFGAGTGSQSAPISGSQTTPKSFNPRSFACPDCNIAFRIRGHMAKHLRAKVHIMKLESLGKIPVGSFAKMEETGVNLNDIDTSSLENALASIRALVPGDDPAGTTTTTVGTTGSMLVPCSITGPQVQMPVLPETVSQKSPGLSAPRKIFQASSTGYDSETSSIVAEKSELQQDLHSPATMTSSAPLAENVRVSETPDVAGSQPVASNRPESPKGSVIAGVWIPPAPSEELLRPGGYSARIGHPHGSGRPCSGLMVAGYPSPTPGSAMDSHLCSLCKREFKHEVDMQVHLQADHLVLLDGKDFKCPRANCGRVYPNRENLRTHIELHYCNPAAIGSVQTPADSPTIEFTPAEIQGTFGAKLPQPQSAPHRLIKSTSVKVEESASPVGGAAASTSCFPAVLSNSSPFGSDTTSENSQDGHVTASPGSPSPAAAAACKYLPIRPIPSKGGHLYHHQSPLELFGGNIKRRSNEGSNSSISAEDIKGETPPTVGALSAGKPAQLSRQFLSGAAVPLPWVSGPGAQAIPPQLLSFLRPFICEHCDAGFTSAPALSNHVCPANRASACSN